LSCGDLLLFGAVVRVDSFFEAHVCEQSESLPLAPLELMDQVRNYSTPIIIPSINYTSQHQLEQMCSIFSQQQRLAHLGDHHVAINVSCIDFHGEIISATFVVELDGVVRGRAANGEQQHVCVLWERRVRN